MKKILLCISALLLIAFASIQAFAWWNVGIVGGKVLSGVSNGLVGNQSGANNDSPGPTTYPGNDQALSGCFAATTTGVVRYIHVAMSFSSGTTGQQYNAAIYDSAGTTLIGDGALSNEGSGTPIRTTIQLDSDVSITATTTYCLSFGSHNSTDSWSLYATNSAGSTVYYDSSYTVGETMPSTVDVSTVKTANSALRIWATNTSDGS